MLTEPVIVALINLIKATRLEFVGISYYIKTIKTIKVF